MLTGGRSSYEFPFARVSLVWPAPAPAEKECDRPRVMGTQGHSVPPELGRLAGSPTSTVQECFKLETSK